MKKDKKITGYDVAYYVSILTIIGAVILAIFQFINKTNEWDKVFMFLILGFIGFNTNKENRKKERNKKKMTNRKGVQNHEVNNHFPYPPCHAGDFSCLNPPKI